MPEPLSDDIRDVLIYLGYARGETRIDGPTEELMPAFHRVIDAARRVLTVEAQLAEARRALEEWEATARVLIVERETAPLTKAGLLWVSAIVGHLMARMTTDRDWRSAGCPQQRLPDGSCDQCELVSATLAKLAPDRSG